VLHGEVEYNDLARIAGLAPRKDITINFTGFSVENSPSPVQWNISFLGKYIKEGK
jgi:hypothetical protein